MSEHTPAGVYVYQPFGFQHAARWAARRIFGVSGVDPLATIEGLTRAEADACAAALSEIRCIHGVAPDVHCCHCHDGFIFDQNHECPAILADQ